MENGTQIDEGDLKRGVSRGPSLFERVTGSAKNTISGFSSSQAEAQTPEPKKAEEPAPVAEIASVSEPTLGGMDSEERIQGSSTDDDLLDIPAFLRRQAN